MTGGSAPGDRTPSRDGGGRGGRLANKAGATSSTGGIAGDLNVPSTLFAVGGATTCLRHRRSTARVKVGKGGGVDTGRWSLRRILQRAGRVGQQAAS